MTRDERYARELQLTILEKEKAIETLNSIRLAKEFEHVRIRALDYLYDNARVSIEKWHEVNTGDLLFLYTSMYAKYLIILAMDGEEDIPGEFQAFINRHKNGVWLAKQG